MAGKPRLTGWLDTIRTWSRGTCSFSCGQFQDRCAACRHIQPAVLPEILSRRRSQSLLRDELLLLRPTTSELKDLTNWNDFFSYQKRDICSFSSSSWKRKTDFIESLSKSFSAVFGFGASKNTAKKRSIETFWRRKTTLDFGESDFVFRSWRKKRKTTGHVTEHSWRVVDVAWNSRIRLKKFSKNRLKKGNQKKLFVRTMIILTGKKYCVGSKMQNFEYLHAHAILITGNYIMRRQN